MPVLTPFTLVLWCVATYRLTLLVTRDAITRGLRERAKARLTGHGVLADPVAGLGHHETLAEGVAAVRWGCRCGYQASSIGAVERHVQNERAGAMGDTPAGKLAYLITCPWCASIWLAAALAPAALWAPGSAWWLACTGVLAASAATGLLATIAAPPGDDS